MLSCFNRVQLFPTLWNVAHQALLSMGFSRQEYWRWLPFPSPGDLSDQGSNPSFLCLLHYRQILYNLSYQESWALKNWCFWTVVLEKTLESPLEYKEIQPVYPKGNQSWIFIGRTDTEAETPVLWPPDVKYWLIGKDPDARKDWRQEEKGIIEDEMVGWHHWLGGHEFEQTPGAGDNREAWRVAVHRVAKSLTWLSGWTEVNWTELG